MTSIDLLLWISASILLLLALYLGMGFWRHGQPDLTGAMADHIVVTFAQSGMQLPWQTSSGNLLDFAEANGIPVSSGCRAGRCGTCQTSLRSGEVAYRQAPLATPAPGNCLLCVGTPKTHVTLAL